jgi:hypothetical protein
MKSLDSNIREGQQGGVDLSVDQYNLINDMLSS